MDSLELFALYVFPLLVFVLGMMGNILSLIILSRRSMKKIGPRKMYIYLFESDVVNLALLIVSFLQYGYNYDLTVTSKAACKIFWYLNFTLEPISPILLVYISFEKVISIRYPSKRFFYRNSQTQFIFFLTVSAYNSVAYIPILFFFTIKNQSIETSNTTIISCDFKDEQSHLIAYYFDTVNRVYIPWILMIICSLFLVNSIIKMRNKINESFRINNHKQLKKDIQLIFSLLFLNLTYFLLNLPALIAGWISFTGYFFVVTFYILYLVYGINFFVILANNSLFRKEFVSLLVDFVNVFKLKL